jgi:hypothetical protein
MNNTISSTETTNDIPLRRNVDIGPHLPDLEKAATEDSFKEGKLYTIPEFVREILEQFVTLRNFQREHDMPLMRPSDITTAFLCGDIIINTKKYKA